MEKKFSSLKVWLPLIVGLALAIGVLIGGFLQKKSWLPFSNQTNLSSNKIKAILDMIDSEYVDSVNVDSISEEAIAYLLSELDPHSAYIPAKDVELVNQQLESSFSGIGVQFKIIQDTVLIVAVIDGGPSQAAGIKAGDRIIKVNDTSFVGKNIKEEMVFKKLRGKQDTKVKLSLKRIGSKNPVNITIVRGMVPVKTVDAAYMLDKTIGYIRVTSFGEATYDEFFEAVTKLKAKKMKKLVVDLRSNTGGYLNHAVNMVNEFLPKDRLIVYTEGKAKPKEVFNSNGKGMFQEGDLIVLIDEHSASASEIFAGAMQDNDRALIVGRRSFGKGLVQTQKEFTDGSAIRLTIARYYTPSGRCIQKPYVKGDKESYEMDIVNRFLRGEINSLDSVHMPKGKPYKTVKGRTVYGGGGIMPDVYVPRDTTEFSNYYDKTIEKGYGYDFSFMYCAANANKLKKFKKWENLLQYLKTQPILTDYAVYADKRGLHVNPYQIRLSQNLLENVLYAYICRNVFGEEAFIPVLNDIDPMIYEVLLQFEKKNLFDK